MSSSVQTAGIITLARPGQRCDLALVTGSSDTGIYELFSFLSGDSDAFTKTILTLRAERAFDGFIVGALSVHGWSPVTGITS